MCVVCVRAVCVYVCGVCICVVCYLNMLHLCLHFFLLIIVNKYRFINKTNKHINSYLHYTEYSVQCTLYITHCTLYTV